ncbi:MAG TPA: hypothetical protein VHR36_12905 [Pyrinomonadaceae bacterium]|nr:hypothetical protein [Pyrinomonadaceae bacterium]
MSTIRLHPEPQAIQLTKQRRWILQRLKPVLAVAGVVISASNFASGEEASGAHAAILRGIEHVLYLSVKSDSASPLLTQASGGEVTAKLTVTLRISAHSQETNFFGSVPAMVSDFDLAKGSQDQVVWRDGKCHHERGFPKITVTNIDGFVISAQQKHAIGARWRVIGLFLPRDEVMTSRRIGASADKIGSYIATRTETKQSRLLVDLRLYILPCDLTVAAQQPPAAASVSR